MIGIRIFNLYYILSPITYLLSPTYKFKTKKHILENLLPEVGDVIIISSSDDPFVAEISAKNSALWTLATN